MKKGGNTMEFRENQKVRVTGCTKSDGTCSGCNRGHVVAEEGEEGFVCQVTEFLFEPVIVVHFLHNNKKIGFRKHELEIIEDYDPDKMEWTVVETV
jgi:nitrogen fixation protein NifZ